MALVRRCERDGDDAQLGVPCTTSRDGRSDAHRSFRRDGTPRALCKVYNSLTLTHSSPYATLPILPISPRIQYSRGCARVSYSRHMRSHSESLPLSISQIVSAAFFNLSPASLSIVSFFLQANTRVQLHGGAAQRALPTRALPLPPDGLHEGRAHCTGVGEREGERESSFGLRRYTHARLFSLLSPSFCFSNLRVTHVFHLFSPPTNPPSLFHPPPI